MENHEIDTIYVRGWLHNKNREGLELVGRTGVRVMDWDYEQQDGILMITDDLTSRAGHPRIIYGPHVDFNRALTFGQQYAGDRKILYNTLAPWQKTLFDEHASNEKIEYICLPFPVDVETFRPTEKQDCFFIYFKNVHSSRLDKIVGYLRSKNFYNMEYKMFVYGGEGGYHQQDYLAYLQKARFGVWVGRHESQGFAFQEALSCDCPLFVYDVDSLNDECYHDAEYPHQHNLYPATCASYFDASCGKIFRTGDDLEKTFGEFLELLSHYSPREFVLENLSVDAFKRRLRNVFQIHDC